jgi:hypothetical protein
LLFFRLDDFNGALLRATSFVGSLETEPATDPRTERHDFALRDPDGYYYGQCASLSR